MKQLKIIAIMCCMLIASCAMLKPNTKTTPTTITKPCTTCNTQESASCLESCSVTSIIESGVTANNIINLPQDKILIMNESEPLKIGSLNTINFTLVDKNNNQIIADDLQMTHTKKIHLMIIDPTLTDYQHIHPILVKSSNGEHFTFDFTPKSSGYIMWADITPNNIGHEYIKTIIGNPNKNLKPDEKINNVAKVGSYKINLVFEGDVKKDVMTMLIAIITKNGKPVKNLQPIMGTSAHIAVFANNGQTLIHTHPEENTNAKKGIISFHLDPKASGYAKMFVQFKVNGVEYFAPFGFKIQN